MRQYVSAEKQLSELQLIRLSGFGPLVLFRALFSSPSELKRKLPNGSVSYVYEMQLSGHQQGAAMSR